MLFDQVDPENILRLYWLYCDVAQAIAMDEEKLQWFIWATADFHPLSNNIKIREAKNQELRKIS